MKLTINRAFNLLNLVLPSAIDGKRIMLVDGNLREVPGESLSLRFDPELKHRDLRNRRKLRQVLETYDEMRLDVAERLTGERNVPVPEDHPKHAEFTAECAELASKEVEVDLRRYKLEHFALEKNEEYPVALLEWLDREGLLEDEDEVAEAAA